MGKREDAVDSMFQSLAILLEKISSVVNNEKGGVLSVNIHLGAYPPTDDLDDEDWKHNYFDDDDPDGSDF